MKSNKTEQQRLARAVTEAAVEKATKELKETIKRQEGLIKHLLGECEINCKHCGE